jgi:hypothetical protein
MVMVQAMIATITMAMDIHTGITIVNGLVIVRGMVIVVRITIVNHGVDPGAGDDFKNSKATGSIMNFKLEIETLIKLGRARFRDGSALFYPHLNQQLLNNYYQ